MYDVIVIGAGPAGMMASIIASPKKKVLLIEKNDVVGKKLLLTGGSRCNLTNLKNINNFIEGIPVNNKFLYSTLNNFSPEDIFNYFTNLGVNLKIEDNDRVFPVSNKSDSIVKVLYEELVKNKVKIHLNEEVENISQKEVITNKGKYKANSIIVATGGASYPHTGSTGDGYKFANEIKQGLVEIYPAETFLIGKERLPLEGITLNNVIINFDNKKEQGSLLFTKNGVSGPAVFKISEYVYKHIKENKASSIKIDLLPDYNIEELVEAFNEYNPEKEINSFVRNYLPKRLADFIVNKTVGNRKIKALSKVNINKMINEFKNFEIDIKETGSLKNSFVTGGGINVKEINPMTMESKTNKNIYFIGEALDIHGHTGGYNITIALSTGYTAGKSV